MRGDTKKHRRLWGGRGTNGQMPIKGTESIQGEQERRDALWETTYVCICAVIILGSACMANAWDPHAWQFHYYTSFYFEGGNGENMWSIGWNAAVRSKKRGVGGERVSE